MRKDKYITEYVLAYFIHIIKMYSKRIFKRCERLIRLSGRKGCKQAHSLEEKNGGNTSKY